MSPRQKVLNMSVSRRGGVVESIEEGTIIPVNGRKYVIGRRIADITNNSEIYAASLENHGAKLVFKYIRSSVNRELIIGEREANESLVGAPFMVLGFDFVEIKDSVGYFMDYFNGGDLLEHILNTDIAEHAVREMAFRVLRALHHMHGVGWVHRDVKLENIFLSSGGDTDCPDTFLADLGLAGFVGERPINEAFTAPVGSLPYCAPELLGQLVGRPCVYGAPVDMWAFGVTLFAMLVRQMPFPDANSARAEFVQAVVNERWNSDLLIEEGCSEDVIDLITNLLKANPDERLTADQALQHPFFASCGGIWKLKEDYSQFDEAMEVAADFDF